MVSLLSAQVLEQWPQKAIILLTLYLIIPSSPTTAPNRPKATDALDPANDAPRDAVDHHIQAPSGQPPQLRVQQGGVGEVEAVLTLGGGGDGKRSEAVGPATNEGGTAPHSRLLRRQTIASRAVQSSSSLLSTPSLSAPPVPHPSPPSPEAPFAAGTPLALSESTNDEHQDDQVSGYKVANDISDIHTTPEQPDSTAASRSCPLDERGRPICPGEPRAHLSLATRRNELADAAHEFGTWLVNLAISAFYNFTLSPFAITALLFHLLLAVQAAAASLEDLVIRTELGAPALARFPRGATLGKRVSRGCWKLRKAVWRHGRAMAGLVGLAGVVGVVGWECCRGGATRGMWQDAPFGEWLLPEPAGGDEGAEVGRGRSPFRELVLLESFIAGLALLQAAKHLLPASILPPTVSIPPFLLHSPDPTPGRSSHTSRAMRLDSLWLLDHALLALANLLSILQALVLVFLLPSYSPLSLPPHLLFHRMRARGQELARLKSDVVRTVECLETVLRTFPREGSGVAAGAREDEFVCTICFEGAAEGGEAGRTANLPCRLGCGHQYHAGCLVRWLHHQSFCPVCHLPLSPGASANSASAEAPAELPPNLLPPVVEADGSDVYPGMRRRAAVAADQRTPLQGT